VEDLPLEVRFFDYVEIHEADGPYAGSRQVHGGGRAEAARSHQEYASSLESRLAGLSDFREYKMPLVSPEFFVRKIRAAGI